MTIKRKRSESEFSLASSSTFSSPDRPFASASASAFNFMDMNRSVTPTTPSHLPSRTMKRFRDGRPPEEIIHQRTLNMLYSAAQKQPEPQQQQQQLPAAQFGAGSIQHHQHHQHHHQQQHQPQQASLHNFWKLPPSSAAAANASSALPPPSSSSSLYGPTRCEDCGHALGGAVGDDGNGDVDSMMDVDSGFGDDDEGTSNSNCGACGKHVCSHCSITNLGEQRRCLACAGRRGVSDGANTNRSGGGNGLRWFATATTTAAATAGVGVC
ncbi:hypothetical protein SLS62_003031 [Diatrype stigma]|uniref:Uncharacterized protein n=1 Tax=Diatrype stigma TaxID=117547 RepID=A0AAN9UX71_9PEZI